MVVSRPGANGQEAGISSLAPQRLPPGPWAGGCDGGSREDTEATTMDPERGR